MNTPHHEAIIIGGGQAGLATAYYLLRDGVDTLILDNAMQAGGAWTMKSPTLALLSDATTTSLPGLAMPPIEGPLRPKHLVEYLTNYEGRFDIPVQRPVRVATVTPRGDAFRILTDQGEWTANQVIMATGTWARPVVPQYDGTIVGQFWHAANYRGPETYAGKKVAIIGAGQSGAEIAAELSEVADVTWFTQAEPRFLSPDVTGPDVARTQVERGRAELAGESVPPSPFDAGDIILTPQIRAALEAGLTHTPVPETLDDLDVNHFIWATGYEPGLYPVRDLVDDSGRPTVDGLYLVGYGEDNNTGAGSDTVAGVGQWAEHTALTVAQKAGKR